MFDDPRMPNHLPRPFGVFYETSRPTYEDLMKQQIQSAKEKKTADLDRLLRGNEVWTIA
jgi:2-oxoglutarate ferredoxin oxidoreductase subunit beta